MFFGIFEGFKICVFCCGGGGVQGFKGFKVEGGVLDPAFQADLAGGGSQTLNPKAVRRWKKAPESLQLATQTQASCSSCHSSQPLWTP